VASSFRIKCQGCKELIFDKNDEGYLVTKNIKVLESNPRNGKSIAICKKCNGRNYIDRLILRN
jgi:hypothetical protein